MARDQIAMTSQLQHLATTVAQLRDQMSAQADFAVDAIQQVRDEATGARKDDAAHPGAKAPKQQKLPARKLGDHISQQLCLDPTP